MHTPFRIGLWASWLLATLPAAKAIFAAHDVSKRWGGRSILNHVNLSCGPSDTLWVVGENGAGKSTLLRIVAGLVEPDTGEVRICGHTMAEGGRKARRSLGYAPDGTDAFPELTVGELVKLVASLRDVRREGGHFR